MESQQTPAKTIAFDGLKGASINLKNTPKACSHNSINADVSSREIVCNICHITLDPFDYIVGIGQRESIQKWRTQELKTANDKFSNEINELAKQVANLKAQKRRLDK